MPYVIQSTIDKSKYFKGVTGGKYSTLEYSELAEAKIFPTLADANKTRNKYYALSRQTIVIPI